MIKFWSTTFWFLWNIKHYNHPTFMNQKVVLQNFINELTCDKYFSKGSPFIKDLLFVKDIHSKGPPFVKDIHSKGPLFVKDLH